MNPNANCTPEPPGKPAGVNAPPQFGICIVDRPPAPPASPDNPAATAASARKPDPEIEFPADQPCSVVAKVANLLIHRHHDLPLEPPVHWEDGFVQQKVLMSLQVKESY